VTTDNPKVNKTFVMVKDFVTEILHFNKKDMLGLKILKNI